MKRLPARCGPQADAAAPKFKTVLNLPPASTGGIFRAVMIRLAVLALLIGTMPAAPAASLRLKPVDDMWPDKGPLGVYLAGTIAPGDAQRFEALLGEAQASLRRFLGLFVDSVGGDLTEGVRLAEIVQRHGVVVVVESNATCASACALLVFGGVYKVIQRGARIGVHSAGQGGIETDRASTGTIGMARLAAELGAPAAIVGRMVLTPPGSMAWLTEAELLSIRGVRRIHEAVP